ncbi:MAG: RNA-binding protein [candidate division Zixibacteria bacterium]
MQNSKLYVGNLSYSVGNQQLEQLFAEHGEVKEVRVIEGKGFGFVEMTTPEDAEKAIEAINGTEIDGRTVKVDEARPQKDKPKRGSYQNKGYQRY